jgi:hypothetical protein
MTLGQFIASGGRNAWVKAPGFEGLYVRRGPRILNGERFDLVLDLATMNASKPGRGAFTRLVTQLHPRHILYVENALEERFQAKLLRMGFRRASTPMCFYLLIGDELRD